MLIVTVLILSTGQAGQVEKANAAARVLLADLNCARLHSLGSAADPCIVVFEPAGIGYRLARASDPATAIADPATGRPYRRVFGEGDHAHLSGVTVDDSLLGTGHTLAFTASGGFDQASDATVALLCGNAQAAVVVTAGTGNPRLGP